MKPLIPDHKTKAYRSKAYREHITTHPCWRCGKGPTEAAHSTFGRAGTAIKASDSQCLPECDNCHRIKKHMQGKSPQAVVAKTMALEFILEYIEKKLPAVDSHMLVMDFLTDYMQKEKI